MPNDQDESHTTDSPTIAITPEFPLVPDRSGLRLPDVHSAEDIMRIRQNVAESFAASIPTSPVQGKIGSAIMTVVIFATNYYVYSDTTTTQQ